MAKDKVFVEALHQGTTNGEIQWKELNISFYKGYFSDPGESVEIAFFYEGENKEKIVVYRSKMYLTDEYGDEYERSNVHVAITKPHSFKQAFKISDSDLDNPSSLWTLIKIIQRQASRADDIMDSIINKFLE
ncbi:hypothetical protein [Terribacillus saccharophilus]|uniref:hypothetical protein n=1 Tax=Terribacillus saccharophilus TaxID=361277 RepID=UPI002DC14150|nr:hypothetical protein [Terribacillus saccharophilus]MEC0288822.1 hypothetical protein [Terribacillus saccharophilus]